MDNESTNRPRLGSAILDLLPDNITKNTPNSVLSFSWLKLLSPDQYPNILKIYGDPTEKNQYFTLTDRNTGYPISQRDLLLKSNNTEKLRNNLYNSQRYDKSLHEDTDEDWPVSLNISGDAKNYRAKFGYNSSKEDNNNSSLNGEVNWGDKTDISAAFEFPIGYLKTFTINGKNNIHPSNGGSLAANTTIKF